MKNFLYRILCGFFLGLSVFAPGFSGSVIAIIMGIYQDLLSIVSNPFKKLKQNILFCLPLVIGALISGVLFVIAFTYLFKEYPKATYILFVGLVAGNLPTIFSDVRKNPFKKRYLIGGVCAFAAALTLGILAMGIDKTADGDTVAVTSSYLMFAVGGFLGGASALVPGMSVSIILMIVGIYWEVMVVAKELMHFEFDYLIHFGIFGVCALAGLVLASKGIKVVFDRIPGLANITVFGFVGGSLIGVLVQSLRMNDANFNWIIGGIALAVGLGISMLFVVLGKVMQKDKAEA